MYKFIDLFAGCGGLGEGFRESGFDPLIHLEINNDACDTLRSRMASLGLSDTKINKTVLCKDITSDKILIDITNAIDNNKPDIIIGGPPCQGFSIAGSIGRSALDDKRNHLFKEYVKVVRHFLPKMFLMENVSALARHDKGNTIKIIVEEFKKLGYNVHYKTLNASDYGVPQERRRVFIIGSMLDNNFVFPEPQINKISIKDTIDDLPILKSGEKSNISNHNAMNHTEQMLNKMQYIKPGGNRNDIPVMFRPKSGDARKYIKYAPDKPSICVTGDMRKVFHYSQNRALTARELARLQTFPDDYKFVGSSISVQQQIGNAVPVKLAKVLADAIKEYLDERKYISQS